MGVVPTKVRIASVDSKLGELEMSEENGRGAKTLAGVMTQYTSYLRPYCLRKVFPY